MSVDQISLDIGGTKTAIMCTIDGEHRPQHREPTDQSLGYEGLLRFFSDLIKSTIESNNIKPSYVSIASPGAEDPKAGKLRNSNTVCLNNQLFRSDLEKLISLPIALENDANCFALAEYHFGAAKNYSSVFGVILGTGTGGGIVINGEVVKGRQSIGGEWGHNELEPEGELCYCGKKGCVEKVISGSGMQFYYKSRTGKDITVQEILEKSFQGDSLCKSMIDRFLEGFAKSISVVINILDPEVIVLGGGQSNIELLYSEGIERVKKYVFNPAPDILIVKNKLGDSAGIYGAAMLKPPVHAAGSVER